MPHPVPATTTAAPTRPVALSGWKLTLPIPGRKGHAAIVDPAAPTPPWLILDPSGGLTLWAPVAGSTTPNSSHARTELDHLTPFDAATGRHVLTASVTVTQLPRAKPEVIIGQIHGAGVISSVPFVLLHDDRGAIAVVVKHQQSGPDATSVPLLTGVPLGRPIDFTISDNGDGSLTFTATADGRTATASVPVPEAFRRAPVRFQAGAYQQADSTTDSAGSDDGARVTFHTLTVSP
ncbi:MAG: polysaccharide lyase family 7 protein [Pseudonocardia sp.]|nr:polysaccharide lyase family 7 protein [Pseudonocardia sp.]